MRIVIWALFAHFLLMNLDIIKANTKTILLCTTVNTTTEYSIIWNLYSSGKVPIVEPCHSHLYFDQLDGREKNDELKYKSDDKSTKTDRGAAVVHVVQVLVRMSAEVDNSRDARPRAPWSITQPTIGWGILVLRLQKTFCYRSTIRISGLLL